MMDRGIDHNTENLKSEQDDVIISAGICPSLAKQTNVSVMALPQF
jgi:hypothetical protein